MGSNIYQICILYIIMVYNQIGLVLPDLPGMKGKIDYE